MPEVIRFCELGQLGGGDLCWTERLTGWTPLSKVPEFAAFLAPKVPELPPMIPSQGNGTYAQADVDKRQVRKQGRLICASLLAGMILGGQGGWLAHEAYSPQAAIAVQSTTMPTSESFAESSQQEPAALDKQDEAYVVEPEPAPAPELLPPKDTIAAGAKVLNRALDTTDYRRGNVLVSQGMRGLVSGTLVYPIRLKQGDLPMTLYYAKDTFGEWVVFVEGMKPVLCHPNG